MINFKQYLEEQTIASGVKPVESLPLIMGHDGVAAAANMLQGLHKTLTGKKSDVKTAVDLKGTAITFGIHPKNKRFFISNGGQDSFSPEEAEFNHSHDPELAHEIVMAHNNIPLIMPRNGGIYNGRILYTKPNPIPDYLPMSNANMGISIESDKNGDMLSNSQRSKFNVHPNVYTTNPDVRTDPINYPVDLQHNFGIGMEAIKRAYGRVDPDALDLAKSHRPHLEKYIQDSISMDEKPNAEGYAKHLMQTFGGRAIRADTMYKKDQQVSKYSNLSQEVFDNKKDFDSVIGLLHPLHQIVGHLGTAVALNKNPGNVTLSSGGMKALLKVPKP